jgi:hypothetical protein
VEPLFLTKHSSDPGGAGCVPDKMRQGLRTAEVWSGRSGRYRLSGADDSVSAQAAMMH